MALMSVLVYAGRRYDDLRLRLILGIEYGLTVCFDQSVITMSLHTSSDFKDDAELLHRIGSLPD